MDYFDSSAVKNALPYPQLIEALARGLQLPIEVPSRSYFAPNADASCVLIMPAWKAKEVFGVKTCLSMALQQKPSAPQQYQPFMSCFLVKMECLLLSSMALN